MAPIHGRLLNQEILADINDINDVQVDVFDNEDDESVEGESVTKPAVTEAKKSYLNS